MTSKIDDLLEQIFSDFYNNEILNNEIFTKLCKEKNFIKSQNIINKLLDEYINSIPEEEYKKIAIRNDSINVIIETIKKYIMIFLLLALGLNYKGESEMFVNNVVELIRNQKDYSFKVDNFLNAEGTSLIILLYHISKNIFKMYGSDKKIELGIHEPYFNETTKFFSAYPKETIDNWFNLKILNKDIEKLKYNIIFILLVVYVYKVQDKKKIYEMINQTETSQGEYMFIEIVEPVKDVINFSNIENVLTKKELFKGLAFDIWDFILEKNESKIMKLSNDEKINILFNSGIIIPIVDDFMLYNKSVENYDKKNDDGDKKKSDTRMKYIINKIETTIDLYSNKNNEKTKESIIKNFSSQLLFRKAIMRNNEEEYKIINKLLNQGKRSSENDDYLNELINFRRYVYVNFKDFDKYGFSNTFDKTVSAIRAVNFENDKSVFRQINSNNLIQIRVGAKDTSCNITGLFLPSKAIQCIKLSETQNIRHLSKEKTNGYEIFVSLLKQHVFKNKKNKKSVYWIFDIEKDKTNINTNIENIENISQETIKNIIADIYNVLVKEIYYEIIENIDNLKNKDFKNINNIIEVIQDVVRIPIDSDIKSDIEKYIFTKIMEPFDINTDVDAKYMLGNENINGIDGDIIKLPTYYEEKKESINKIVVDLSYVDISGNVIIADKVIGICQHNISWDNLRQIQKMNYTNYLEQLYIFIQQYVILDTNENYICKSCGYYMDITNYIQDGNYDSEKGGFVTYSMPMEVKLEDMPEYYNLQFMIKIMDKNIDKIASSVGISYFSGNTTTIKWRRKIIIKNTIDMINDNQQYLTKNWKNHNDTKLNLYGVSHSLSNLFVFIMEDNIFKTSTKDKDQEKYKILKKNNITAYILLFLILELNESQIMYLTTDKTKTCDIGIFDKVYTVLFSGLKIKKNNTNETIDIKNYKILCYLIYMISCKIAKYRMWIVDTSIMSDNKNPKKLIPIIQKYIVHTCVDIINASLVASYQKGANYKYEIFRVKFFEKLNGMFKDDNLYNIILENNKIINKETIRSNLTNVTIQPKKFIDTDRKIDILQKSFSEKVKFQERTILGVSNLTNCDNGNFHKWYKKDNSFVCKLCSVSMDTNKFSQKDTDNINKIHSLMNISKILCVIDEKPHDYQYDEHKKINFCNKCNNLENHDYSQEEIKIIEKIIKKKNNKDKEYTENINLLTNKYIKEDIYIKNNLFDYINNISNKLENSKFDEVLNDFITLLQSYVGTENNNYKLKENIYIIDHDQYGNSLSNIINISQDENKIKYKNKHVFFNTDVIYYTNSKGTRVDIFYGSITRKLLGYKEGSKDFVNIKNTNKQLKINYSILNKLKYIGFKGEFINLADYKRNDKKKTIKQIINEICTERNDNLKKLLLFINTIFKKIINNIDKKKNEINKETLELLYYDSQCNEIINKYISLFKNIIFEDKKTKFFENWKEIYDGIFYKIDNNDLFDNGNEEINIINADDVMKYDKKTPIIIYYIIEEFKKLFNYNNDKFIKINIANMFIDIINNIFLLFNKDEINTNLETIRFSYIVNSTAFAKEMTQDITQKMNEEFSDDDIASDVPKEEIEEIKQNNIEEQEALDIDNDVEDDVDDLELDEDHNE